VSKTVNTGWLKNNDGEKFAPKTLLSQVQNNDGVLLEVLLGSKVEVEEGKGLFSGSYNDLTDKDSHTHSMLIVNSNSYGTTLPEAGVPGRIFFKKV
jgi:hypothetical protein